MTEIFIDIETGGLNPQTDAICTITLKIDNLIKTWFIKPYDTNYNEEALKINGLSLKVLSECGKDLVEVLFEMGSFIQLNANPNKWENYLIGHNLHFDLKFLEPIFDIYSYVHYHYYDTMITALYLRKLGVFPSSQKVKLTELYKTIFGKDELYQNAHTSEADVLMTEKIWKKFLSIEIH